MSGRRKRVYLHVGVPKSGTTFLQATLAGNREQLAHDGVLYPASNGEVMFRSALDVRGNHAAWGRSLEDVQGTWERLCRRAQEHDGTTLISHELFAAASTEQIETAVGRLAGLEVQIVVTARDPARQVVAEWQEGVKHGRTWTFAQFVEAALGDRDHPYTRRFAAAQDLPAVLGRWSRVVGADRVQLVCCPPPAGEAGALWQRFAGAVGLNPQPYHLPDAAARNRSLGVVQIHLLRRVNEALGSRLVQPDYGRVVKRYFAQELLAATSSPRPVLPPDRYDDLVEVALRWQREIEHAGYAVHGDLAELLPVPATQAHAHPDHVDTAVEADTAAVAIADLLVELERAQSRAARLQAERDNAEPGKRTRTPLKRRLTAALRG